MQKSPSFISSFILLLWASSLIDCATHSRPIVTAGIPPHHIIKEVPYVLQKKGYCAPASAEMVLRYYGINQYSQDLIATCDPAKGTHWLKLRSFLNSRGKTGGFTVDTRSGSLELLKQYISFGYPVIVRQWADFDKEQKHYRVVIGYDERKRCFILHDPNVGHRTRMQYAEFEDLWSILTIFPNQSSNNLMIIIRRTPQLANRS